MSLGFKRLKVLFLLTYGNKMKKFSGITQLGLADPLISADHTLNIIT